MQRKAKMRPLGSDALILVRNERQRCQEASRVRKTKKQTDELNKHKGFQRLVLGQTEEFINPLGNDYINGIAQLSFTCLQADEKGYIDSIHLKNKIHKSLYLNGKILSFMEISIIRNVSFPEAFQIAKIFIVLLSFLVPKSSHNPWQVISVLTRSVQQPVRGLEHLLSRYWGGVGSRERPTPAKPLQESRSQILPTHLSFFKFWCKFPVVLL